MPSGKKGSPKGPKEKDRQMDLDFGNGKNDAEIINSPLEILDQMTVEAEGLLESFQSAQDPLYSGQTAIISDFKKIEQSFAELKEAVYYQGLEDIRAKIEAIGEIIGDEALAENLITDLISRLNELSDILSRKISRLTYNALYEMMESVEKLHEKMREGLRIEESDEAEEYANQRLKGEIVWYLQKLETILEEVLSKNPPSNFETIKRLVNNLKQRLTEDRLVELTTELTTTINLIGQEDLEKERRFQEVAQDISEFFMSANEVKGICDTILQAIESTHMETMRKDIKGKFDSMLESLQGLSAAPQMTPKDQDIIHEVTEQIANLRDELSDSNGSLGAVMVLKKIRATVQVLPERLNSVRAFIENKTGQVISSISSRRKTFPKIPDVSPKPRTEKLSEKAKEEMQRVLTGGSSVLPESGYQQAAQVSPEELKRQIERFIKERRGQIDVLMSFSQSREKPSPAIVKELSRADMEFQALLAHFPEVLTKLGGDTRKRMIEVYNGHDYSTYWFMQGFGRHDEECITDQLRDISSTLNMPIGSIKVLDVGTGGKARIMKMIAETAREEMGPDEAEEFIKNNIRGFDLVSKVVRDARESAEEAGISPFAIFEGDFLNLPEEHQREEYHLVTVMMHTGWHCTTEEDWIKFLKNVERALDHGGRLVLDTVDIIRPVSDEAIQNMNEEEMFADLMNFYSLLWRKYCDDNQPVVEEVLSSYDIPKEQIPRLIEMPRYFVEDRTAGVTGQSFVREIPTKEWIEKLCKSKDIKLEYREARNQSNLITSENELRRMGSDWLHENKLKDWLKEKIARRLKISSKLAVAPQDKVNEIYERIALSIAQNYANQYLTFEKIIK